MVEVFGFDGDCDQCTYQQIYGVSFDPPRPCYECFECGIYPVRNSGFGAGSGICCVPETQGTGCVSDEEPDCDDGYTSNCIYDGGYAGGCIQLGFFDAPVESCQERLVPIEPDKTYRITYSWEMGVSCGKCGNVVRGRCEGENALFAFPGNTGGSIRIPTIGVTAYADDYADVLCETGSVQCLCDLHETMHDFGNNSDPEVFGYTYCDGKDQIEIAGTTRILADLSNVPGGCDYRPQAWGNHFAQAPILGNPNHAIGPDVASGCRGDSSDDHGCYGGQMTRSNFWNGGIDFSIWRGCPSTQTLVAGSAWLEAAFYTDPPECLSLFCDDPPNNSDDPVPCAPNNGCIKGECPPKVLWPWIGIEITGDSWGERGSCSRWSCCKQFDASRRSVNESTFGIPDPIIIPPTGNCAFKLKTCATQGQLTVGYNENEGTEADNNVNLRCAEAECGPRCEESEDPENSPGCSWDNGDNPYVPLRPSRGTSAEVSVGIILA